MKRNISFLLLLLAFPFAASAAIIPSPQLAAYPALSAADLNCAGAAGAGNVYLDTRPGASNYITPITLGILCNLPPSKQGNDAYLAAMFIEYVDSHRFTASGRCPSHYDVAYNGAPPRPVDCAF